MLGAPATPLEEAKFTIRPSIRSRTIAVASAFMQRNVDVRFRVIGVFHSSSVKSRKGFAGVPMDAKVSVRYNEAVAIERGPLVYALKIDEQWTRVNADKPHRELPHGDFEVRPASPWNVVMNGSVTSHESTR